ncbi:helix-turn-helix domain-containing protein [Salinisphaera hydrothermalis]|uniref:helix-turn-helix domain-containing protein n=1 Tax=Salinisphaera hydrothermalis TaxID=563188 RepID=UPI0033403DB4
MRANSSAEPSIGDRLRQLRRRTGLSLDACARRTGISKAMLGQVERGESSPTIATLWKIATGLDVSLSYFLSATSEGGADRIHHAATDGGHADSAGMRTQTLWPYDAALGFEMFAVEFAPGSTSTSSPHAAGTVEHVVLLEGELTIEVGGRIHELAAGDVLQFAADRVHRYHNPGAHAARAHDLIHYAR